MINSLRWDSNVSIETAEMFYREICDDFTRIQKRYIGWGGLRYTLSEEDNKSLLGLLESLFPVLHQDSVRIEHLNSKLRDNSVFQKVTNLQLTILDYIKYLAKREKDSAPRYQSSSE